MYPHFERAQCAYHICTHVAWCDTQLTYVCVSKHTKPILYLHGSTVQNKYIPYILFGKEKHKITYQSERSRKYDTYRNEN